MRQWMLVVGLGLASVLAGCDSVECRDEFDCRDQEAAPAGQVWTCQEEKCVAVTPEPPDEVDAGTTDAGTTDAGPTDAGVDAGTPDAGVDAGMPDAGPTDAGLTDAGTPDAGPTDAGVDAGTPPTAYVRFVNVLFEGNSSEANTPWDAARYRMDVYPGDGAQPLFSGVETGDTSVTDFVQVTPGTNLAFTLRTTGKPVTEPALATLRDISLAEGERLTLVALGLMSRVGQTRYDVPKLLALKDKDFGAVGSGEARLRHVTADRVVAASRPRFIRTDSGLDLPNVSPFTADTEVQGHVIPVASTTRLLVRGSNDSPAPSQSGELGYTLPAGALQEGRAYFAVSFGDDRRAMNDPGAPSLLLIPAGTNGALRMKRDPLLYFFNALESGAPLRALSQGVPVATDFQYGADPKPGDLPASAAGHPLKFVLHAEATTTVLDGFQTGPLEAGGRYLVVVGGQSGATGEQGPRAFIVPDTFPSEAQDARVRFVNACLATPAPGATLGYFDVATDGSSRGGTFTALIDDVAYGMSGGPAEGVAFTAPTGTDATGSYFYYAVRGVVGGTPTPRSVKGLPLSRPHLFLLMGSWETGPTFRAFNLRNNTWSVLTPRGGAVFEP